jgi:hypothetical protein
MTSSYSDNKITCTSNLPIIILSEYMYFYITETTAYGEVI